MPPTAFPYGKGMWSENDAGIKISVDCLLPTGIIIQLQVEQDAKISEIKEKLWNAAQNYPLYSSLRDKHSYVFMIINEVAEKVELLDEEKTLDEVKLFCLILKVVEKKGNTTEKVNNAQISLLLGKGLHDFDNLKSSEVSDFRQNMRKICEQIASERDSKGWLERALVIYPPVIHDSPDLFPYLMEKLDANRCFFISVRIELLEQNDNFNTINSQKYSVSETDRPDDLIRRVIHKQNHGGYQLDPHDEYVLKVCGKEDYFLGNQYRISQYKYIRTMLARNQYPMLSLVHRDKLLENQPPPRPPRVGTKPAPKPTPTKLRPVTCTWDINDDYKFTVEVLSNVECENYSGLQMRACIYHGPDQISNVVTTNVCQVVSRVCEFKEELRFTQPLADIPRMARLCFVLSSINEKRGKGEKKPTGTGKKKAGKKHEDIPLAWLNIPIFDYKGSLKTGPIVAYMWPISKDDTLRDGLNDQLLNPIGTVESNPMLSEAVEMKIDISDFNEDGPLSYPEFDKVLDLAARNTQYPDHEQFQAIQPEVYNQLDEITQRNGLTPLEHHEKDIIWNYRFECQHSFQDSLPKVLACVQWNDRVQVAQMMSMLQCWTDLEPVQALELLDFAYADKSVREFAVKCIQNLSDVNICDYLLQLVQVLKYEPYLECKLVEFLLRRALNNNRIGHYLFWLLKSEMHVPSVSVRFGLILEAYCRGNISHLPSLSKQVDCLQKLKAVSEMAKSLTRNKAVEEMKKMFEKNPHTQAVLSNLHCTLEPMMYLRSIRSEKCKIMDSKMRPLWLVWTNKDTRDKSPYNDPDNQNDAEQNNIYVMYKNGDDLRQDMLTIQIFKIMDSLWKSENLDFHMNIYECLATGHKEGLIELVTNASTLAMIQREESTVKFKSAFNQKCLYSWLKKKKEEELKKEYGVKKKNQWEDDLKQSMEKIMDTFMYSCAGSCIATYVLGIADRHSDNILLCENGQLVHIDFGHFLGHYKKKLGYERENAPFVLLSEFIYLLHKGSEKDNAQFKKFEELCLKGYLVLRKHAKLLITLFMMMMNTGIPELSQEDDLEYLKNSLVPDLTEAAATKHYKDKFKEALKASWRLSFNNAMHNIRRDNN